MKYRVLIVEDDNKWISLLSKYFEKFGYDVISVKRASDAEEKLIFAEKPFDVVCTDMNLEGDENQDSYGGLRVLDTLSNSHRNEVCVILSGQSLSMDEVKRVKDDYTHIDPQIVSKGDSILNAIKNVIHPMVLRRSLKVFLSYRRSDSRLYTKLIYRELKDELGHKSLFRDVNHIDAGEDFREKLRNSINEATTVLVMIGETWTTVQNTDGKPRLFDPADYVRLEIEHAIRKDKRIIPVLLDSAVMPSADDLPVDLIPLASRNAIRIRSDNDSTFATDIKQLVNEILKDIEAV